MARKDCWYFVDGVRKDGFHKKLKGRAHKGLRGDISGLRGDISGLRGDISDDKLAASITQVCPQEGGFIAWKKLRGNVIAKLEIPDDARRLTYIGSRKCRADMAIVVSLSREDGQNIKEGVSLRNDGFVYRVGEKIKPDSFDDNIRCECSHGIHFFITREEAERWQG